MSLSEIYSYTQKHTPLCPSPVIADGDPVLLGKLVSFDGENILLGRMEMGNKDVF